MIWKKRTDLDYNNFRKEVLQRDKHTCQMPNCGSRKDIVIHHIMPYAKSYAIRTDPNNGICLCCKHHRETMGKEKQYSHIFLSIVYEKGITK